MTTRTRGRGPLKTRLEPLPLSTLAPLSTLRSNPNDRGGTRTPLTALLDGASTDAGLASPSLWLRTPPVPTPRQLEPPQQHHHPNASLSKMLPPGASQTLPLIMPGVSGRKSGDKGLLGGGGGGGGGGYLRRDSGGDGRGDVLGKGGLIGGNGGAGNLGRGLLVGRGFQGHTGVGVGQSVGGNRGNSFGREVVQGQGQGLRLGQGQGGVVRRARPVLPGPGLGVGGMGVGGSGGMFGKGVVAKKILPLDKSKVEVMQGRGRILGMRKAVDVSNTQIARAIRNREAASKSRQAAKLKVKRLEDQVRRLRERVVELEKDGNVMRGQLGLPPLQETGGQVQVDDASLDVEPATKRARKK